MATNCGWDWDWSWSWSWSWGWGWSWSWSWNCSCSINHSCTAEQKQIRHNEASQGISLSLSVSSTVPAAFMQNTRSPEGGRKEAGDGKEAGDEGATGAKLSQVEASHFYLLAHTLHIMCQAWGRGSRGSGSWQAGGVSWHFFVLLFPQCSCRFWFWQFVTRLYHLHA